MINETTPPAPKPIQRYNFTKVKEKKSVKYNGEKKKDERGETNHTLILSSAQKMPYK